MRYAITDRESTNPGDRIRDSINQQIYEREREKRIPKADPALIGVFNRLVKVATEHKSLTGRYLQIWGELGELYAATQWGVKRHRPNTQGSDGKIGNDFVEVKTISPEKSGDAVAVKRAGNFNKLLVVRINHKFKFEAKMIDRCALRKGTGRVARVPWKSMPQSAM